MNADETTDEADLEPQINADERRWGEGWGADENG
jgi:hypothetical protein